MNLLRTFIFSRRTCEGLVLHGAGIVVAGMDDRAVHALIRAFTRIRFGTTTDPFEVDWRLAAHAARLAPESVVAIGLSVGVPGVTQAAGGVIGAPRAGLASADGDSAGIGHGLSVAALPGGPGIVVLGSPDDAARILGHARDNVPRRAALPELVRAVRDAGIPLAIAVVDGSGMGGPGGVATVDGDTVRMRSGAHRG